MQSFVFDREYYRNAWNSLILPFSSFSARPEGYRGFYKVLSQLAFLATATAFMTKLFNQTLLYLESQLVCPNWRNAAIIYTDNSISAWISYLSTSGGFTIEKFRNFRPKWNRDEEEVALYLKFRRKLRD